MQNIIVIALGGTLGALSRYELGLWISNKWNQNFPYHTFSINVTGVVSPLWRLGIGVGFLGAYTTFSTFGYEVFNLIERENYSTAAYTVLSIVVGFIGVALGAGLARIL